MKVVIYLLLLFMLLQSVRCQEGVITTIAGTGSASYSGDNGAATSATLNYVRGVALDVSGRRLKLLSAALVHCNMCS